MEEFISDENGETVTYLSMSGTNVNQNRKPRRGTPLYTYESSFSNTPFRPSIPRRLRLFENTLHWHSCHTRFYIYCVGVVVYGAKNLILLIRLVNICICTSLRKHKDNGVLDFSTLVLQSEVFLVTFLVIKLQKGVTHWSWFWRWTSTLGTLSVSVNTLWSGDPS